MNWRQIMGAPPAATAGPCSAEFVLKQLVARAATQRKDNEYTRGLADGLGLAAGFISEAFGLPAEQPIGGAQ